MKHTSCFLALCSDKRFWLTADRTVLLGDWCRPMDGVSSELVIMPSPWDQKRDIDAVGHYLDLLSERLLEFLHRALNAYHEISLDLRDWRILAGNWVLHVVHTLYDRYGLLNNAIEHYPNLMLCVPKMTAAMIPRTVNAYKSLQLDPIGSLLAFSQLCENMSIPLEHVTIEPSELNFLMLGNHARNFSIKGLVSACLKGLHSPLLSRNSIAFQDMGLKYRLRWKLGWKQFGLMHSGSNTIAASYPMDLQVRRELFQNFQVDGDFEQALKHCLPMCLPASLLEDFKSWFEVGALNHRYDYKVVLTQLGFSGDEKQAHALIQARKHGSLLMGMQHGGGYGSFRYCPEELHETRCSDRYFTWGWTKTKKQYAISSLYLSSLTQSQSQKLTRSSPRGFLLITTDRPPLTHRVQSHPLTGQMQHYKAWQERFYLPLSTSVQGKLSVKPYWTDYVKGSDPWWSRHNVPIVQGKKLANLFHCYQLFIFDHNATGYLESLALNLPTIIFWDPQLWELDAHAVPFFDMLEKVGVFHKSPESAAKWLSQHQGDLEAWWRSDELQSIRSCFCQQYARATQTWVKEWNMALELS